jgi:NAD+ kinase
VNRSTATTTEAQRPAWRQGVLGVVVHPRRQIDNALDAARQWAEANGGTFAQVVLDGQNRKVADPVAAQDCDLIVAIGGDGTVLASLRCAGPVGRAVLGVACGSLGAMTSVQASEVGAALDRFAHGEWEPRALPGMKVERDGKPLATALNDVVVVRKSAGQVILDIQVDGSTFARTAGDGVVVATPLGSSAYTLAAGGPLLSPDAESIIVTPLAPHGGSVPPLVLSSSSAVTIDVDGGFSGARVETDGQVAYVESPGATESTFRLDLTVQRNAATLLDFDHETLIAGLRRRGVIADSPRLRARDARR